MFCLLSKTSTSAGSFSKVPFDKPLAAIALGESKQQLSPQENIMTV